MPIIFLNKIIYSPKRIIISILVVITVIIFSLLFYFYVFAQNPDNPIASPGSQFQICTGSVSQPACYDESSPRPTLNWTFTSSNGASSQIAYWIQIDDNGNDEGSYPSPEANTGEILSSNTFHIVNPGQLQFNTTYYWKIAVEDNFNTWSGWTCADTTFTTAPPCNNPPTATNLSVVKGDYSASPAHYFSWTYSDPEGDNQSQFHFQVDNNSDFGSLEVDWAYGGLSNPSPTTNNQTVIVAVSPGSDQIAYNTTYYWRIMVWDSQGAASIWTEGSSFTTEKHRYPFVNFSWFPTEPSAEEDVQFTDESVCYDINNNPTACVGWDWDFETDTIIDSTEQSPIHQFAGEDVYTVTLWVTDADGYTSSNFKTVDVQVGMPDWREILPW